MGFLYITTSCVLVLCLFGAAPVLAQDSGSSNGMETWKLIAIIVPSAVGGLTLISVFIFCCCCQRNSAYGGSGGLCGDGCGNCGAGCGDCGAGCCDCGGCCGEPHRATNQRTVYTSSQGPVQVQQAHNYRSAPQPITTGYYKEPTYVSNLPVSGPTYGGGVYGGARAPVYGGGGRAPIYGSGGGCGC